MRGFGSVFQTRLSVTLFSVDERRNGLSSTWRLYPNSSHQPPQDQKSTSFKIFEDYQTRLLLPNTSMSLVTTVWFTKKLLNIIIHMLKIVYCRTSNVATLSMNNLSCKLQLYHLYAWANRTQPNSAANQLWHHTSKFICSNWPKIP